MRRALLFALAACGGSSGHAGDAGGDGTADASYPLMGHAVARQLANDPSHMPIATDVPLHTLAITAHLDDGRSLPITAGADGSFTAPLPAPLSRLEVATDTGAPTDYELPASTYDLVVRQAGRYDRVAPVAGTNLSFTITNPGSGNVRIVSTGIWTQTTKLLSASGSPFQVDWSTQSGLLDASLNDRVYYTVETNVGSPQYLAVSTMCSADVTMQQGATTDVACTAAALPQDQCTHVIAHVVDEARRVAAAASPAFTGVSWDWTIGALPDESLGPTGQIALAHDNQSTTPTADLDRMITYAQPYPGHTATVALTYGRTRTYALPSLSPATLRVGTTHWVKPPADCSAPAEISGTVALATTPALDGVTLDGDNLALAFDAAHPHVVTWQIASGTADHWIVRVMHVYANAGATDIEVVHSYITTATSIALDPAIFVAGEHYLLDISGAQSWPNAATGDLRTIGYPATPYATSQVMSGVFTAE